MCLYYAKFRQTRALTIEKKKIIFESIPSQLSRMNYFSNELLNYCYRRVCACVHCQMNIEIDVDAIEILTQAGKDRRREENEGGFRRERRTFGLFAKAIRCNIAGNNETTNLES